MRLSAWWIALLAGALWVGAMPASIATPLVEDYAGTWIPDQAANAKLAKNAQKQMRKRIQAMHKSEPPPQRSGGMGEGPPGGMSGGPPGGMPPGGPPGGPPSGGGFDAPNAVGVMRPEMDFAAPLQGDLVISQDAKAVRLGRAGTTPVELSFKKGARELGDSGARAFADYWENGWLVVEINTDDGIQVTHTYVLEARGERLRIRTHVAGGPMAIPGGMDFERVYNRAAALTRP